MLHGGNGKHAESLLLRTRPAIITAGCEAGSPKTPASTTNSTGPRTIRATKLSVLAEGTDLRVGVEGRKWINCAGHENFPDGEVFTGPIEDRHAKGKSATAFLLCMAAVRWMASGCSSKRGALSKPQQKKAKTS